MPSDRHTEQRARDSLSGKMWLIPTIFVGAAVVLAEVMLRIDGLLADADVPFFFRGPVTGGQGLLTIIATSMLGLMGVVFSISIVALQLASTQFSPRVLRTFLRDRKNQYVLGQFAATFVYAIIVLARFQLDEDGDAIYTSLSVSVGFFLVLACLAAFIYFIHHMSRSLRVVHIIEAVAVETRLAIDYSYPEQPDEVDDPAPLLDGAPTAVLPFDRSSGVIAAVDWHALAALAAENDCVLHVRPAVGEYVARTMPFCEVRPAVPSVAPRVPQVGDLLAAVDVGPERTMFQDVGFGFRQLVDIAEKALSPAVNDPTTAVQVLDRLTDFLLQLANRPIPTGVTRDRQGVPRVVHPVVSWDGFVDLAFDEIRDYGSSSLQVVRRLRAALDDLIAMVPSDRIPALERQRFLLDRSLGEAFTDTDERRFARRPDEIGVGLDD